MREKSQAEMSWRRATLLLQGSSEARAPTSRTTAYSPLWGAAVDTAEMAGKGARRPGPWFPCRCAHQLVHGSVHDIEYHCCTDVYARSPQSLPSAKHGAVLHFPPFRSLLFFSFVLSPFSFLRIPFPLPTPNVIHRRTHTARPRGYGREAAVTTKTAWAAQQRRGRCRHRRALGSARQ